MSWTMAAIKKAIEHGGGQTCNASGVVRELYAAGFVIVPKEPTENMVIEGSNIEEVGTREDDYMCVPIWRAMIEAA